MIELSLKASLDTFSLSIDTCINSQGITAIFGPSGAGKTSLLRHIAGLAKNPDCRVVFNQSVWQDGKSKLATAKRGVAYVFQQPHLFEHLELVIFITIAKLLPCQNGMRLASKQPMAVIKYNL